VIDSLSVNVVDGSSPIFPDDDGAALAIVDYLRIFLIIISGADGKIELGIISPPGQG
jgi:hypothetical protein